MRLLISVGLFAVLLAMPVIAEKNLHQLARDIKPEAFKVSLEDNKIALVPREQYDNYIISVSGDGDFKYEIESKKPVLDIYEVELPYDGKYNYEIKAVRHFAEVKSTMNNGRDKGASAIISVINVNSGEFEAVDNIMTIFEEKEEPQPKIERK